MQRGLVLGEEQGLQRGLAIGEEQGLQRGLVLGQQEEQERIARTLLPMTDDDAFIARATGLDEEEVRRLRAE